MGNEILFELPPFLLDHLCDTLRFKRKVNHFRLLIVFIGIFCDMTIIGHPGGQRIAVRLDVFTLTIAYLRFLPEEQPCEQAALLFPSHCR